MSTGGYSCSACNSTADKVTIGAIVTVVCLVLASAWYMLMDMLALDTAAEAASSCAATFGGMAATVLHRLAAVFKAIPWNSLRVPLVVIQTLTQFLHITGLKLPNLYSKFLGWLSVINLDMKWLLSAGCIVQVNFFGKLLTTTLLPLGLIAVLGLLHLHVRVKYRTRRSTSLRQAAANAAAIRAAVSKHSRALLGFTFLIFSPVSTVVFQTFACDYLEGTDANWLRADYSISCDSATYKAYRVYGVFMILLYPLGIPALYSYLLYQHRDSAKQSDELREADPTLSSTRFLWSPYTPDAYWWEVAECMRRLLLAGFLVFILPGTPGQAAVSCVFAIASMVAFGHYRPFIDPLDAKNYWLGCVILFLSMFVALLLVVDYADADSHSSKQAMSAVLILLNLWLFISAIIQVVVTARTVDSSTDRARSPGKLKDATGSNSKADGSQSTLQTTACGGMIDLECDDDDSEDEHDDDTVAAATAVPVAVAVIAVGGGSSGGAPLDGISVYPGAVNSSSSSSSGSDKQQQQHSFSTAAVQPAP
jgi:hypothetical protein